MRLDKLTTKAQEAVQDAVEIARKKNNQPIQPCDQNRCEKGQPEFRGVTKHIPSSR